MAAPAGHEKPDEWELVEDDGFVYRRKKRPRHDPPTDPAPERKGRRERKKRALLKLRDEYLQEISRWELLSNILKELERNAQAPPSERQESHPTTSFGGASTSEEGLATDATRRRFVDDLLSQVEAQEATIRDVSNLCDVAEALCSAHEERLKQQLTNLPIWDPTPAELMATLGEQ